MRGRHKPSKDEVYHPQIVVDGSSIETLMFLPRMRTLVKSHFKALEICQGGGGQTAGRISLPPSGQHILYANTNVV